MNRAAFAALLLCGTVLVDSWVVDGPDPCPASDSIRLAGQAPEVLAPAVRICPKDDAGPARSSERPLADAGGDEPRPGASAEDVPPPSRAVDPSAWLGRRHFRSPT